MRLPVVSKSSEAGAFPLWPPLLVTRGAGARSDLHAHHALHFVLAAQGELKVRGSARGPWLSCAGVLTAQNAVHAIDAEGVDVLFVFFDPQSSVGASLLRLAPGGLRPISGKERDLLIANADPLAMMGEAGARWTRCAAAVLGAEADQTPPALHPRVRRLLRLLQANDLAMNISLEALAAAVGLSPGRMMHAFTESVGVPLRPYLAWLKLQRAAGAIVAGLPLAEAAQVGGFSDAGHMSRTFRRMFGVAPSRLRPPRIAAS